jgi:hypothetical protein
LKIGRFEDGLNTHISRLNTFEYGRT